MEIIFVFFIGSQFLRFIWEGEVVFYIVGVEKSQIFYGGGFLIDVSYIQQWLLFIQIGQERVRSLFFFMQILVVVFGYKISLVMKEVLKGKQEEINNGILSGGGIFQWQLIIYN